MKSTGEAMGIGRTFAAALHESGARARPRARDADRRNATRVERRRARSAASPADPRAAVRRLPNCCGRGRDAPTNRTLPRSRRSIGSGSGSSPSSSSSKSAYARRGRRRRSRRQRSSRAIRTASDRHACATGRRGPTARPGPKRSSGWSTRRPPSFRRRSPYYYLSRGEQRRDALDRARGGRGRRQRTDSDRPGHRVRLLVRPRRVGAARSRSLAGRRQQQSRDRFDRLRHLRRRWSSSRRAPTKSRPRIARRTRAASCSRSAARRRSISPAS